MTQLINSSSDDGYQAIAANQKRELEAFEWCNTLANYMVYEVVDADGSLVF